MFAQILTGILLLGVGISHFFKADLFLSQNIRDQLSETDVKKFQEQLIFPFILLGIICISMGVIEPQANLGTTAFVMLYIVMALIPLSMIVRSHKRYTGYYFPLYR